MADGEVKVIITGEETVTPAAQAIRDMQAIMKVWGPPYQHRREAWDHQRATRLRNRMLQNEYLQIIKP